MLRWLFDKLFRRRRQIVVISPRWNDIWAGSTNNRGVWGSGTSVDSALGDLILRNQEKFGIEVIMAFGDKPAQPLGESYVTIPESQYGFLLDKAKWSNK